MDRVDRLLRWVWLIIGVVVLLALVSSLVFVASEAIGGGGGGGASAAGEVKSDSADGGAGRAAPLRYDPPEAVRGSAARIVVIRRSSGYAYRSTASSAPASGEAPAVNVAFLQGDGARLLLDRPAYIRRVAFPGGARAVGDSLRWIVYEMALEDTDGNGRVDESDRRSLYVSDLAGRGLRRVTPPGYELRDWAPQPDGTLVATAVQLGADGARMPLRAFVLDAAGAVKPYAALDSIVDAAGRIVAKRSTGRE